MIAPVHVVDYRVDAQIAVRYQLHPDAPDGRIKIDAGYTSTVSLPRVTFRDGRVVASDPGTIAFSGASATGHFEGEGQSSDCAGNDAHEVQSAAEIHPGTGASQVILRP